MFCPYVSKLLFAPGGQVRRLLPVTPQLMSAE
jgi:hypothetical protein